MRRLLLSLMSAFLMSPVLSAGDGLDRAVELYDNGMYLAAMDLLQNLPDYGNNPKIDGYYALCAMKQKTDGYLNVSESYLSRYKSFRLCEEIRKERALDFFNRQIYNAAAEEIDKLSVGSYPVRLRSEFVFKRGYSLYMTGDSEGASREFGIVLSMARNDYSAPAAYCCGYISYMKGEFTEALKYFEDAEVDERFAPIASYYIVNCRYEMSDFDFVLEKGIPLYEDAATPDDRKMYLARIISEAFLVKGDKTNAKKYYALTQLDTSGKTRDDSFYAGSLMYAIGDWQAAVDNYAAVTTVSDSLSQIASYQSAFSYLNLKNKVEALRCFEAASSVSFDGKMTEDAMFNYAKLAFDVNGDASIFDKYMEKYSDKERGELIYSYMALAALTERHWQAALDAYDKIDVLCPSDRNNYIRANYLRGVELLENGSYRNAVQCFKTVAFSVPKTERINQLSRYALGEVYYRNAQYEDARKQYQELYNASALFGMPEADMLPYNMAWSYLKGGNLEQAAKWFDKYAKEISGPLKEEAMLRRADCFFAMKDYKMAVEAYDEVSGAKINPDIIYPYYRSAVANGLLKKQKRKLELLLNVKKAKPSSDYYAQAYFELGKTYQAMRQFAPAVTTLREVYKQVPQSPYAARAMLEIGTIKRNIKDIDGSIKSYKIVIEKMPDSPYVEDALLALESIYQSLGKPSEYLAYIDKIGRGGAKTEEERIRMVFSSAEQLYYTGDYSGTIEKMTAFKAAWPKTAECVEADWYIAESYRETGDKVRASDAYSAVMEAGEGKYRKDATRRFAEINYSLENYSQAEAAWSSLLELSGDSAQDRIAALSGKTKSCYRLKRYDEAISSATVLLDSTDCDQQLRREVMMIKARSCMETSRREEALKLFGILSAEPSTPEGAEASYMIILDCFNRADYKAVEDKCFAFAPKSGSQRYYLAKSYLILGDAYAEQGLMQKAEATFKSLEKNYTASDDVSAGVRMRLEKLQEMNQR